VVVAPGSAATLGTESPNQIELIWERHRRTVWVVVVLLLGALGANYAVRYFNQRAIDGVWSGFVAETRLDGVYASTPGSKLPAQQRALQAYQKLASDLFDEIAKGDVASWEKALPGADPAQKPYLLWFIAAKSVQTKDWDRAERALKDLEAGFPNHSLVVGSDYPVQIRADVKEPEEAKPAPAPKPKKEVGLQPAKSGSAVAMMRDQIARERSFTPPAQFQKPQIPSDAKRIKVTLSGSYGSFTIALMEKEAPEHCKKVLALAQANHWKGMNVDEIHRPSAMYSFSKTMELHFGLESSRDSDRSKWLATDPSKEQIAFENNDLSHFAGAVAARAEGDDKSAADRWWIVANDAAATDGSRVIFAYVVDGLDTITKVCEATMSSQQEEESGRGKPSENITIESVEIVQG